MSDRLHELALDLADDQAFHRLDENVCMDFERYDTDKPPFGTTWYDLKRLKFPREAFTTEEVADAVEYLNLRGLLEPHPTKDGWVRRRIVE